MCWDVTVQIPHSIPNGVLSRRNIWVCVLKAALGMDVLSISYFYSVIFFLSSRFMYQDKLFIVGLGRSYCGSFLLLQFLPLFPQESVNKFLLKKSKPLALTTQVPSYYGNCECSIKG